MAPGIQMRVKYSSHHPIPVMRKHQTNQNGGTVYKVERSSVEELVIPGKICISGKSTAVKGVNKITLVTKLLPKFTP